MSDASPGAPHPPDPPPTTALIHRLSQKEAALAGLREISRATGAALDLDTTLSLITKKTAEVSGMDSCSIYLLDPPGEWLVLRASTGLAAEAVGRARLRWGEGLTGWAADHAQPVASSDAARDPRFVYLPETREHTFRSLAAVPLISGGKVLGAMNVQTTATHEYGPDEIELLGTIADLAAGAIEKAALYDSMRRQITELSTLAEVSKTLTSPLYLEEMLGVIAEMATRLMHADRCAVLLLDEESGALAPRAAHGVTIGPEEPILARLAGEALHGPRVIAVTDITADADETGNGASAAPRPAVAEPLQRSLLAVPLTVREKPVGVFLALRTRPHRWSPAEIERLTTLGHQTALAIENSTLVVRSAVVREMHHRVKNNLQTIAMLLRLQVQGDREVSGREVLTETVNRILSIATVHEILSVEGFRMINARDLLDRVARAVTQTMARPHLQVEVAVAADDLFLPSQPATSLALAVNELVQNALEHAFPGRTRGRIGIRLYRREHEGVLEVSDDGVGASPARPAAGESLGLRIVQALAIEDLHGSFGLEVDGGTRVTITFPVPDAR